MPKPHPKIYTNPPNSSYGYKHRDLAFLKRERDIGRKAVLSDVKAAFTCTPALRKLKRTDVSRVDIRT